MSPTINRERLDQVSLDDLDLRNELIRLFLSDAPAQIQALSQAVRMRDLHAWTAASHRLKGGSGNLGAERLAELCSEAEAAGRRGLSDDLDTLFSAVQDEFGRAEAELARIRGGGDQEGAAP